MQQTESCPFHKAADAVSRCSLIRTIAFADILMMRFFRNIVDRRLAKLDEAERRPPV